MNYRQLEADLRDLIAPELAAIGAPTLYTIWQSQTDRPTFGMHGFTSPRLSSAYRNEIEAKGTWQGIAPGIFLCDNATLAIYPDHDRALRTIVSTAAHELGHVVADGFPFREVASDIRAQIQRRLEILTDEPANETFPSGGHDLNFIRATMHIGYRLESMGHDLEVDDLWLAGELFKPSAFLPYLHDELEAMRGLSLSEVLATDPPEQFTELYLICQRMAEAKNN